MKQKRLIQPLILIILLIVTWVLSIYHMGVFSSVGINKTVSKENTTKAFWIDKKELGVNHLVLFGSPFQRGKAAGQLTSKLIDQEERQLIAQFKSFFPNPLLQQTFILMLARWFYGIEDYFEPWMLEEIYGVSLSTTNEFNDLADPYTRQVAYHGLHEVGQMFVDFEEKSWGCTVLALPHQKSWVIGRNFDFEAGRIFDEEKILKWVFPNSGYAFVSVTWGGMVGVVTGINEHGVYISINAAGSTDFSRYGTPSTLVALKALQFSKNIAEAKKIIEDAQMFITDIFVLADRKSQFIYRIEKSPDWVRSIKIDKATGITNHLVSKVWKDDKINKYRKTALTSLVRANRAQLIVQENQQGIEVSDKEMVFNMLSLLRDKNAVNGKPLHLGNRLSIDALVATHSIIYNANDFELYVSQGPALVGAFSGFNLTQSFKEQRPVVSLKLPLLPNDPAVSVKQFYKIKKGLKIIMQAKLKIDTGDCAGGKLLLKEIGYLNHSAYFIAKGALFECEGKNLEAVESWMKALDLKPAYKRQVDSLLEKTK